MTYYVTFAKPGEAQPFAAVYQRAGGRYGLGEIAPLGGKLELLPGNLCGSGDLTLSGVPRSPGKVLAWRDRVKVYLSGDPVPIYSGEISNEVRNRGGKVTLNLVSLKEQVSKAAWTGPLAADGVTVQPLQGKFKWYYENILARATLPPGVTVGVLPDLDITLKSVNLFELVGDTFQKGVAATQGGMWGLTPQDMVTVTLPSSALTHRFTRRDSDRPDGQTGAYANCIRFPYTRPGGTEAFFIYKYGLEIARMGEAWLQDTLPTNVTATLVNPYATMITTTTVSMYHPQNGLFCIIQSQNPPAFSPGWTGKLADGMNLSRAVLYGANLPVRGPGDETYVYTGTWTTGTESFGLTLDNAPPAGLRVLVQQGAQSTEVTTAGAVLPPSPAPGDSVQTWMSRGGPLTVKYHDGDLNIYLQTHATAPGIAARVTALNATTVTQNLQVASAAFPDNRARLTLPPITDVGHPPVPQPFNAASGARLTLDVVKQWRSGDVIETDAAVTALTVMAVVNGASGDQAVALTQGADTDTGRRTWVIPRDLRAGELALTGDPAQMGRLEARISDEAGLTVYAIGRLLNSVNPVYSWVGKYDGLRRVTVDGVARFDDEAGDLDLPVTRCVYDLTRGQTLIEAGTPQAWTDGEALQRAFEGLERIQRQQRTPGGTP